MTWNDTPEDVQRLVEANGRMEFLLAVAAELARVRSSRELVCTAMARLRERLGVTHVMLTDFDGATSESAMLRGSGAELRIEIGAFPREAFSRLAAEVRRGLSIVVHDARTDPRTAPVRDAWYSQQGIGAFVAAPLIEGGSLLALLSAGTHTPRVWTNAEVDLVRGVGELVCPALAESGLGGLTIARFPVLQRRAETVSVPGPAAVAAPAPSQPRSLRILVVDDDVDAADSAAMLLRMEGHETFTVNTARAALLAVPDFKPEVVLLDIGLPEMDGYEVARRLRSQNGIQHLRLVAVTGYGQPQDRRRAHAAGFDEHMVKPVEPSALQEFLRTVEVRPSD